jgi:hypothetical protein
MASGPGKPHMYCTIACLCILCPSFAFMRPGLLCSLAILFLLRSPARLRWRPSGKLRVRLSQSFLLSIPTVSCLSQVTTCLLSLNPTFSISYLSESFLRRNSVLGRSAVGSLFRQKTPTNPSFTFLFLIRGLALPISRFFRSLLDFYRLNLTHLNPNSILRVSVFVHLCEAFLGILPHFGLWKYLYHCWPRMAGGQHQLVGGASLEMRRGRKTDYLDIPLKDGIKGWRLEWFIVENHGNSLPPRSGRQLDVRTPSWTESPTDLEVAEAGALLAEVGLLKERGLTAEAVVADFIFKNIQPLKDRAYPAYLYQGLADSTRVTNRRIPAVDLVSRLEMILRGKVSNIGAPVAYSAWNLPPSKAFTSFVSNPPAGNSGLGLRVRPSPEEVSALVASLGEIPDDERQVHFEVPLNPSDAEISAMLDMLAEDSSDAAPAETLAVAPIPEASKTLDI